MKAPVWFQSVVRFFDDRERMHQEITDLLVSKRRVETELQKKDAELKRVRQNFVDWYTAAHQARQEADALRKLVSDEAEARKLAGAVTVLKEFIGRTAK